MRKLDKNNKLAIDHKEKHSHFEVPKIKKYSKMALLFTATKRIALTRYFSIYYIEN